MSLRSVIVLICVLAIAALAPFAGSAAAKKKKKKDQTWDTNATLVFTAPATFSGNVSSKLKECDDGRLVTLWYFDPGGLAPQPLGVDKTDDKGHYLFDASPSAFPGGYQLTVAADKHKDNGVINTCRAGESPKITL